MNIATIGIDIAKNVFQIHGVCADGKVTVSRQLRRQQLLPYLQQLTPCTVGLEACPGAHHWARQIAALGHDVRLMPPQYVKPYVKRQKNDAADAEAICEAVTRPTMRFVPVKTEEQQAVLMLHRTRELLIRQKTMLVNSLRGQLGELGIIAPQGRTGLADLVRLVSDEQVRLPALVRDAMLSLVSQLKETVCRVTVMDQRIVHWHRSNKVSLRLESIPGVGPITASVIAASVVDGKQFPEWATVRGLARLGAAPKLDRWQVSPRGHYQMGR